MTEESPPDRFPKWIGGLLHHVACLPTLPSGPAEAMLVPVPVSERLTCPVTSFVVCGVLLNFLSLG